MIIIHVMGGMGNQLYQYAMYEKLKSMGKDVRLDLYAYSEEAGDEKEWRNLELTRFCDLNYAVCTPQERTRLLDNSMSFWCRVRRKLFGRRNTTIEENAEYMPEIYQQDNCYLYGYWGCERYYEDILPLLRDKIQFPVSKNPKNTECMAQMEQETAISIHIRRKDYLTVADGARYMGICTTQYYQGAMEYIEARIEKPVYYIFSDDIGYAREHYQGDNIHIVDWNGEQDSIFDLQLMSKCKHNICANSTFSMWGARLNQHADKMMIRPLKHDNYETTTVAEMKQNWKNWILLDENGYVCE